VRKLDVRLFEGLEQMILKHLSVKVWNAFKTAKLDVGLGLEEETKSNPTDVF
jgi:hypothetical protein